MTIRRKIILALMWVCASVNLGAQDSIVVQGTPHHADSTMVIGMDNEFYGELPPATVRSRSKKKAKRYGKEWREKYRLVYNFNRVYPYALVGRKMMAQVDSTIEADNLDKRNRDRYIKNVERELFKLFEQDIRHTTISQGFLLTRLVDRECGMSVYDIIYNYEGGFSAGFWNLVGKIFDQDLKAHYDPLGEDAKTEELVQIWEKGEEEWNNFYYYIFWEDPPKSTIKTDRLSTQAILK